MEFDWKGRLENVYGSFPEAPSRPVIGITANYDDSKSMLAEGYYKKVVAAGGVPLIIPPLDDSDAIINTLDRIDGLILSGGGDYNPLFCGEEPSPGYIPLMASATCPICSSHVLPITDRYPCWVYAEAYRPWQWHWEER